MTNPVPIKVIRRREPDVERFAAALLALAIARVKAREAEARKSTRVKEARD